MKTITLVIFGAFLYFANAEFTVSLLTGSDGVITSTFTDSVFLSLPPCSLAGQSVNLQYNNTATKEIKTLRDIFKVPLCRFRRALAVVTETNGHFIITKELGYQVKDLTNGTQYSLQYIVGAERSNVLEATTKTASDYAQLDEGLPAHSGAMVVITVLLSVAMFLLVLGLIVTLFLSNSDD
ncbi:hypothetical protein MATL_G00039380 [Megalops atlanticus]|uniref:Uroplakin-2 n=1 Tax=Megalops atlanticus TaxID=7932 RepID=A0A9D3QE07_MEGAT|nr:hypothetical protein MATL_G00039380 [Megalops atlanticus]